MTPEEITQAINTLTAVVKANTGWFMSQESEQAADEANAKIRELIKLLPAKP